MAKMQGIDNYITNSKYSTWWADLTCSKCGAEWSAVIEAEFGRTYFRDNEKMYCPECGVIDHVEVSNNWEAHNG